MSVLPTITGVAHSVRVLLRAGMVQPARPLTTARGSRAMRKLGPIAGAANMSALRAPNDVAIIDERGAVTYGELDSQCHALARAWSALGVAEGDVVGVLCRDHRGAVQAMVAAGKLGARLVLLNTGFAKPQLADVATREQVRLLVFDEEFTDLLSAVAPDVVRVLAWTDSRADGGDVLHPTLAEQIAAHNGAKVALPAAQGGLVLLTGGTTGTPKGAPRKVGSPLAAAQFLERVPQRRGDVVYIAAPMFHGTGLSQFIMAFALGSTVVVRRRFDARATLDGIAQHQATVLILVPTMLQRLLALADDTTDASSLRIIMSAGAALPTELGNRAIERFGPVLHNFYGCTEVALATVAMPEDWIAAPGTVGRAPRGIRVALFDADDREITEPGVSGRIFVDNGLKFEGYSGGGGKPMIGAMMGTGDTGHWGAGGRLFVDGRDDDMIVSGGENVFPAEIEDLVSSMPGVAETASIPVDDEDFGVRLRMFVVPDGSATLTEDEIKDHVRANLARFKVPREVVFLDAIPYTAAGKVARRELAAIDLSTSTS
ncbi:AMP-binding protein [Nocardioides speluncae]|uniref:AMP-binding protein n=1 Tax=Nocardioides speluncae TaxID=2670337 RepID=UPI001F0BED7B|nr:AMP-binding protein [Nocardioides speluncae]